MVVFSFLKSTTSRSFSLYGAAKSSITNGLNFKIEKCLGIYSYKSD